MGHFKRTMVPTGLSTHKLYLLFNYSQKINANKIQFVGYRHQRNLALYEYTDTMIEIKCFMNSAHSIMNHSHSGYIDKLAA